MHQGRDSFFLYRLEGYSFRSWPRINTGGRKVSHYYYTFKYKEWKNVRAQGRDFEMRLELSPLLVASQQSGRFPCSNFVSTVQRWLSVLQPAIRGEISFCFLNVIFRTFARLARILWSEIVEKVWYSQLVAKLVSTSNRNSKEKELRIFLLQLKPPPLFKQIVLSSMMDLDWWCWWRLAPRFH